MKLLGCDHDGSFISMKKNILKIELLLVFILTVFSFVTFYYGNALPDNAFTITSDNGGNIIGYYFFSMITYSSYFTGPWMVIPFFIFALSFTFIYDKREHLVDVLNILTLLFLCASITFFSYPEALGEGLNYIFKNYFDTMWLSIYLATAFILFLIGTFRSSFKEYMMSFFNFLKSIPTKLNLLKEKIQSMSKKKEEAIPSTTDVKTRVASMLKSDAKRMEADKAYIANLKEKQSKDNGDGAIKKVMSKLPFGKKEETVEQAENSVNLESHSSSVESFEDNENSQQDIFVANTPNEQKSEEEQRKEVPIIKLPTIKPDGTMADIVTSSEVKKAPEPTKTLNRMADTSKDNQYFDIVTKLGTVKQDKVSNEPDAEYFEQIISLLEAKLTEFKIEGSIVNVLKGPVVDTFEFRPGAGVKVSKIANLSEDLSLALYGVPIRVVPSMMGRDTVGIEVPRSPREFIYLDEVLNSKDFLDSKHALPIAMGKNAFGEPFVIDLASCPHMLVAGATGAGKSVFVNSLLVSLLVKKSPKKMKLILIDPKQLELALYQKLPHLVMPVITDAKTASISLLWAVQEMERRYSILKEFGVRNISGFNEKLKNATPSMLANIHQHYEDSGAEDYELPYLVIVVDEFADLILTKAGKEIENNIARLAAKARAAGIHLILATQRPSVDVITGVIKSNFPTRVSFRVTSNTDSRTILDKVGAERLLGKGDMLYKNGINMHRVHSSFVEEDEIEALTTKLEGIPVTFNTNAMDFIENGGEVEADDYTYGSHIAPTEEKSDDDMYNQALKVVMESRSASASMLQRRLRIGYNRAANIVEEMERRGVVGPAQGSKPRKVLMSGDEPSL